MLGFGDLRSELLLKVRKQQLCSERLELKLGSRLSHIFTNVLMVLTSLLHSLASLQHRPGDLSLRWLWGQASIYHYMTGPKSKTSPLSTSPL